MSSMMCGMLLGAGVSAKKTYVDDLFSTYLFKGNATARSINNGVDLSGEGGLVWIKNRDATFSNRLYDTVRGATKHLKSDSNAAESTGGQTLTAFNSNGFSLGTDSMVNSNNDDTASWSFRKAPGFFDIVTYTGTGSARTVDHNLGCIPGMIIIKRLDTADNWNVYHRSQHSSNSPGYYLQLNTTDSIGGASNRWNDTAPTATEFTVGTAPVVNANGDDFVAYVFAGGESTAATARSVSFDGTGDSLSATPASGQNYQLSGDFTIECWVKPTNNTGEGVFAQSSIASWSSWGAKLTMTSGTFRLHTKAGGSEADRITGPQVKKNQWQHIALVRSGSTVTMYVDGLNEGSYSDSDLWGGSGSSAWFTIGAENYDGAANELTGSISNFRVTRGQALYTSSFRPSTEPLTTTSQGATSSNVIVLACNNASVTGATVKDNISSNGDPTASTDSPFDDPAGFKFGENEDQNVIKCGSYKGNGSSTGPEINLGFEPQWVMIKNTGESEGWLIFDSMRGIVSSANDLFMYADATTVDQSMNMLDLTPTGFKIKETHPLINTNDKKYIYTCVRRSDGYVGKPAEAGTDAFNVANHDSTAPAFNANFPVDFALFRRTTVAYDWRVVARLVSQRYMPIDTGGTSTENDYEFDYNNGWNNQTSYASSEVSWMWTRGNGFDVVDYKGNGTAGRRISHSMNQTVEMIWTKNRSATYGWRVWHKGLNGGGSNAATWYLSLNASTAQTSNGDIYGSSSGVLPTSTDWTVGGNAAINENGSDHTAMLFSSVSGISKCGFYDGSENAQTITVGFQPRLIIIKRITSGAGGDDWVVADTLRGIGAGSNDKILYFNVSDAQSTQSLLDITSTGFTVVADYHEVNHEDHKYIYYAHA